LIRVNLTYNFFAYIKSVGQCYVIPFSMTNVSGADRILEGTASDENPVLTNDAHWSVQPKNFVLFGVKYVNPWHGQYLRRGVDDATIDGQTSKHVRHSEYVENDEVVDLSTTAFKEDILPIKVKDAQGNDHSVNIALTFTDDNACTVSSASDDALVSGTGKFVSKGEKKSLGGKDRDAIYLDYTLEIPEKNMKFVSRDTLVLRTRNVYGAQAFSIERK
ncbi:MAG: adhesin, partial [Muribaculaceae bacterium]|nr:adhesin [Muribaculaceae bacterium]